MFVEIRMKDGRTRIIKLSGIVWIERRPPVWLVTLHSHRLARVWRFFRSPMASESTVLVFDADEVRPLLDAIEADRFDPES